MNNLIIIPKYRNILPNNILHFGNFSSNLIIINVHYKETRVIHIYISLDEIFLRVPFGLQEPRMHTVKNARS